MPPSEYFRAVKVTSFLGIPREILDSFLLRSAGDAGYLAIKPTLDANTIQEPYHVGLQDEGYLADAPRPEILVLEIRHLQVDAGVNEIPRATVSTAVGRDALKLVGGATDIRATSVAHFLEKYFSANQLPAKIYLHTTLTATAGAQDLYDNNGWPDEWVVFFDGLIVGLSRRGETESAQLVIHLAHHNAVLGYSSSITANTASGTQFPVAFNPYQIIQRSAGFLPPALSMFGVVALALAGGRASETDFWGYQIPGDNVTSLHQVGVKGFLYALAQEDVFAWHSLQRADLGASPGVGVGALTRNTAAIQALDKIEPKWPAWNTVNATNIWQMLRQTVSSIRTLRTAANSTLAVSRADIIANTAVPTAYFDAGYRYGVPISFWLSGVLSTYTNERAFASDIYGATFPDISAASFWDLIAGSYPSRYQIAICPMATGSVVIPFQPHLAYCWQAIGSSEVFSWEDDFRTPSPLRGVILVGNHASATGFFIQGSDPAVPGAQIAHQQQSAAYDSGETGVFEFRQMPPWLTDAYLPHAAFGNKSNTPGGRALSLVPWVTGPIAAAVADDVVSQTIGAAGVAAAYALNGLIRGAPLAPSDARSSTAYRLAKAIYQQERTRYRNLSVTTRFRYDIGPGSYIKLELPADRYVRSALAGLRDASITGMVTRVTMTVDVENRNAQTHYQLGFVRYEGESQAGGKLYADSHPFWSTVCYGIPWADAQWIRNKLGNGATLAPPALGGV